MMLIMHYWKSGGVVEHDVNRLQVIARIKPSRGSKQIMQTVLQFFSVKDGFIKHKRIDEEIARAKENRDKQRGRTEAAREAKKKKNPSVTESVTASVTGSPSPSPSPISSNEDIKKGMLSHTPKRIDPPPNYDTVPLADVTVEHIGTWLAQMEMRGNKVTIDCEMVLEKMKAHYEANDYRDGKGQIIRNWIPKLRSWVLDAQEKERGRANGNSNGVSNRISGIYAMELVKKKREGKMLSAGEEQALSAFEKQQQDNAKQVVQQVEVKQKEDNHEKEQEYLQTPQGQRALQEGWGTYFIKEAQERNTTRFTDEGMEILKEKAREYREYWNETKYPSIYKTDREEEQRLKSKYLKK